MNDDDNIETASHICDCGRALTLHDIAYDGKCRGCRDSANVVPEMNEAGEKVGADAFLHTALGGNENVATLTFLSLTKLLEAYAEHLLVTIDRQAEQLKAKDAVLRGFVACSKRQGWGGLHTTLVIRPNKP